MAEARLRAVTVVAWLALAASAVLFASVGLTEVGVDTQAWLMDTSIWVAVITAISLITVPAPSGTRLSLGIGAIVSASILMGDVAAFATAVSASLAISWIIKSRIEAFRHRTDTDFLGDALSAAVYAATYVVAYDIVVQAGITDETWSVVVSVAIGGVGWFIARALVAAFVGVERTDLAGRYLWLLSLEDWAVVVSMFAAGALFGLTWPVMGLWAAAVSVLPYAFGHLAFETPDIYKLCRDLMDAGVTINRPPRDGHMAFVRSPDGISVELLQKGDALEPKEPWASMENVGTW